MGSGIGAEMRTDWPKTAQMYSNILNRLSTFYPHEQFGRPAQRVFLCLYRVPILLASCSLRAERAGKLAAQW